MERRALRKTGAGTFVSFVTEMLGIELSDAQRVFASVMFDYVDPRHLDDKDRELANVIFGNFDKIPEDAKSLAVAVCGARSGKTFLGALRILHLALTCDLSTIQPGEEAIGIIVAPTLRIAEQAMNYVSGQILNNKANNTSIKSMLAGKPSPQKIRIQRGDRVVRIEPRAAVNQGTGGRGFSVLGCLMDESAFFRSGDYAVVDQDIFSAIYMRLIPGGQFMVFSTPWTQAGLLFEKYSENYGHPKKAIAAHAPTLIMFPSERNKEVYEMSKRSDPDEAEREYGAQFMSSTAESFFDLQMIESSLDVSLDKGALPEPGDDCRGGCDFAFQGDSSAMVIDHVRNGIHYIAQVVERRPQKDEPLMPSEIIEDFATIAGQHGLNYLMADRHYKMSVIEYLNKYGIAFIDAPTVPSEAYVATRILLHQGRIRLPNHARFLGQLKEVKAKRTAGGSISIILPRKKIGGVSLGHGDLVAAFVLAVYQACGNRVPDIEPDPNTPAGQAYMNEKLKEQRRVTQVRDYDRRLNGSHLRTSPDDRLRNNKSRGW